MSPIPPELIAAIVDELADDRESLKVCSLVATAFCAPSQSFIFRSIWLHRENWRFYTPEEHVHYQGTSVSLGTIQGCHILLENSPHLAAYIRDLTIDLPDSTSEDLPLEHILMASLNIERFVISGLFVSWTDLSPSLVTALQGVMAQPTLTHLHLLSIHGLPFAPVVRALSAQKVLSVYSTTLANDGSESQFHPPRTGRLERLILAAGGNRCYTQIYELLLSPRSPNLAHVTQLSLKFDTYSFRLLAVVAETLQQLTVDYNRTEFELTLPPLPQLHTLELRIFPGFATRFPEAFAETLAALPRTNLTLIFGIASLLSKDSWADTGRMLGLENWEMDTVRCELLLRHSKNERRKLMFHAACAAIRAALPAVDIEFSEMDQMKPYISELP
ncbi:hypothetical protein B0H10DRAFT_1151257 [Mycena sp. CBHHK59/15]|nr:hypothetical protein B0H10DRAFT_1151257 [Mycena sp. CBHHK59/15]